MACSNLKKTVCGAIILACIAITTATSVTGFWSVPVQWANCPSTCANLGYIAINGGTSGQALCIRTISGSTYYGMWRAIGICSYGKDSRTYTTTTYSCACATIAQPLEWRASSSCVTSTGSGASTSPAVCRFHKYGASEPFAMGWITGTACTAPSVPFGPNGASLSTVNGIGGPSYNMQVLCKKPPTPTTCTYSAASNTVTCGAVTCATSNDFVGNPLPKGSYAIGIVNTREFGTIYWYNLYPLGAPPAGQCAWDYYTKVPTLGCRGGFGFHTGTRSAGCVTVLDTACMRKLVGTLAQPEGFYPTRCRRECLSCKKPLFGGTFQCQTINPLNNIAWMGVLNSV